MKLSDRLETVVSFVERCESAADIGTDHGYVPVELVRRGIAEHALAMDVRKGPLSRAEEHIGLAGLSQKVEARLSDGLEKLLPGEADSVVIAGMGGELIIHILEQGRHMWPTVNQWVLSPHSELYKVRKWLFENGFSLKKEDMVEDDGKYYTVMDVRRDAENIQDAPLERRFLYGDYLIRTKNPVFIKFLKEEEKKLKILCENLRMQAEKSDRAKAGLKDAEERLSYNREVQNEVQGDH